MNVLAGVLLVVLASDGLSEAILSGGDQSPNRTEATKQDPKNDSFKVNSTAQVSIETNGTFYYEADTFLLNKNNPTQQHAATTSKLPDSKANKLSSETTSIEPASVDSTSARNGRMLDLDALVGDIGASQSVRARSQTGNRQSRFLTSGSTLEVGKGKKLHIQGFIPIVGVKDVTGDDSSDGDSDHDQRLLMPTKKSNSNEEGLPYAHSSIGHASFVAPQPITRSEMDAKFSGAGVVDTLKKPLKKLMRYGETQQQLQSSDSLQRQHAGGCICVPFYMCKAGFLSESSLGGPQFQQHTVNQQQRAHLSGIAQPKAVTQLMIAPAPKAIESFPQAAQNQASFATFSAQVDERSLNRDIITVPPLAKPTDDDGTNQTIDDSHASLAPNNLEGEAVNSTSELHEASDYSQDILGRMLGIKSMSSSKSSGDSSQTAGTCGLLRTCCNVPAHLIPSGQHADFLASVESNQQQQAQNQMSFGSSSSQPAISNKYPVRYQTNQLELPAQQIGSFQKYQHQSSNALQRGGTPYGFPSMQISRMQLLNNPDQLAMMSTALAHRSNMFSQSPSSGNRFQTMQPSQPQTIQYVPTLHQQQQQHQPAQPVALSHHSMNSEEQPVSNTIRMTPVGASYTSQSLNDALGTRKILEGRCGLRRAAGINGRVQNLQYQENSAEFGEYPAQAAILKRLSGTDSMFVCGGTLISQYWIATAAHCIKKHSISDLKVRLGEWDVHRDEEFYPYVEKGIRDLVVHSEFVPGNLINDIALLRLDSPLDPSLPHINPACLPAMDESFTNQRCWVTGWGKDSFGQKGTFQTVLQEVELPVVGQAECESALKQTRLGPHYRLHSGFICAGGEGGKDACEGDGGSGLYCMQDGLIKVAGLVSWGIGCGQQGVPGVYVNLAHYRPWIENIISIDEDIYSRNFNTTETDKTTTSPGL